MAVSSSSPGPYTAGAAVINVMRRFRNNGLKTPITADVLIRAGVSDSLIPRTMQSLQILELIDETGQPTPTLLKIRSVAEVDYKATLAEWIQSVYAEVFGFVNPETDDPVRIRDAFRAYTPHGQQDRMVSLFMSLCAEAGLAPESKKPTERKPLVARKPVTGSRNAAAAAAAAVLRNNPRLRPLPPPPGYGADFSGLAPALAGLLQSIPRSGAGWTQADRDNFYRTFGAVLDFAVPIISEEVSEGGESDE